MLAPGQVGAEEIELARHPSEKPFLEVRALLESHGVRVPKLFLADGDWALLEDLGDRTLAKELDEHPEERTSLYEQCVSDLVRAQANLESISADSFVRRRAFDVSLLEKEIDHFREWVLDTTAIAITARDRAVFAEVAHGWATTLATAPRSFVHRDYQSRNLMVRERAGARELVWIDFQDALWGPCVYDLASLLADSYQKFDASFVRARIRQYAELSGRLSCDEAEILVHRVTVQRKLKDAGRFVYVAREKGNEAFMRYLPATLGKVQSSLAWLASTGDAGAKRLAEVLAPLSTHSA